MGRTDFSTALLDSVVGDVPEIPCGFLLEENKIPKVIVEDNGRAGILVDDVAIEQAGFPCANALLLANEMAYRGRVDGYERY